MAPRSIEYEADGLKMIGYLAGEDNSGAAVLVFPEAFGLEAHARSRADQLAALGYVALAGDLHGQGYVTSDLNEALGLLKPLRDEPSKIRARAEGALRALVALPGVDAKRVGAIGFCFGGTMALELARSGADVAAVVGFHSGLATKMPEDAKNIRGRVLVCIGADDPSIDASQRAAFEDEMRNGKVNWQMSVYGGTVHAFTNKGADKLGRPEFARYSEQAERRSWSEMMTLFGEVLAG